MERSEIKKLILRAVSISAPILLLTILPQLIGSIGRASIDSNIHDAPAAQTEFMSAEFENTHFELLDIDEFIDFTAGGLNFNHGGLAYSSSNITRTKNMPPLTYLLRSLTFQGKMNTIVLYRYDNNTFAFRFDMFLPEDEIASIKNIVGQKYEMNQNEVFVINNSQQISFHDNDGRITSIVNLAPFYKKNTMIDQDGTGEFIKKFRDTSISIDEILGN